MPTLHATFVFAVYFTTAVSPESGSAQWAFTTSAAAIAVALLSPILGARGDARATRKLWLAILTGVGAAATATLWLVQPSAEWIAPALVLSFISMVALETTFTFYNALLPNVSDEQTVGRVSGLSWAAGYFGAIVSLVAVLWILILPDQAPFGLDKSTSEHVRITMPLAAAWFVLFSIPLFALVREGPADPAGHGVWASLKDGFRTTREIPGLLRFLLVRMLYADGLVVVFAFGGIYAAKVFGFEQQDVITLAIALNVTAGIGAGVMGWLDDRIGGFQTVRVSLLALTILSIAVLTAPNLTVFWAAALAMGFFIGPVQSASRTVVSRVVPNDKRARIFGFYMISGKSTAFLGPLLYGLLVTAFDSERAGMAVAVLAFAISLVLLGSRPPGGTSR